jgi:hypothetical protein
MTEGKDSETNRTVRQVRWMHDGDECVAAVGSALKWRRPNRKTGRFGAWHYGRTVIRIEPNGTVYLDPAERADVWTDSIFCGRNFETEYAPEPSE